MVVIMLVVGAVVLAAFILWCLVVLFWSLFVEIPQTVHDVHKQNKGLCPCGAKLGPWRTAEGTGLAYGQIRQATCANGHTATSGGTAHMIEWGDF